MATNKNQHYVARCVLRPFSLNAEGRAINVFNIDRQRGIQNAPLKNQCSGNYFYGTDAKLESLIQSLEGAYGGTLSSIQRPGYRLTDSDTGILRRFVFFQYCRTEAMAKRAAQHAADIADVAFEQEPPPEWRLEMREAVLTGLVTFSDTMTAIDDLKICLIRNDSNKPFISSDDPVILTNRWYQQNSKAKGMGYGVGSSGAVFLLPMAPRWLCIMYDGDVYNLQNDDGICVSHNALDIDAFNQHQFLNCAANIYFSQWADLSEIGTEYSKIRSNRPDRRHEIITAILDRQDEWGEHFRVVPRHELKKETKALVHIKSAVLKPLRWPSVIRFRSSPKIYSNGSGTGFVRRHSIETGNTTGTGYAKIL